MGLTALTQIERPEVASTKPTLLVEVEMGSLVLRWSTRDFVYKYGSTRIHYEGRIQTVSGLGEQSAFNQQSNPKVTLTMFNEAYSVHEYLSHLDRDLEFQRCYVSFYECLLFDDSEVFASLEAGRTLKWKGVIERLYDLDTRNRTFKLDCCSRLHNLRNKTGLSRVTTTQFPYADKKDVGQWRNLPIGDIDMLPCRLVRTGATDTLFADMNVGAISTLIISGATKVPWLSSGTFQIDDEQFAYTGYSTSTKTFSGVTRAVNGTVASVHTRGASVFQVLTEFVYEASCIPVDGITDVLVDNVRQAQGTSCQVYTGRPGSQLAGYGSAAVVRFTVKPTVKKQVNVEVTTEHAHTTGEGSHGHSFSGATVVTRVGIATAASGNVDNPDYCRDGDDNTAAHLESSYSRLGNAFLRMTLNNSVSLGVITAITVKVRYSVSTGGSGVASISYGGYTAASFTGGAALGSGLRSYAINTAAGWGGYLDFSCSGGTSTSYASLYIYEAIVEITCSPVVSNSPASGVATTRSGATTLGGDSVADVVIGKEVVVAITGPRDSIECTGLASGAITGTSGLLIERPDHIAKYFLCSRMGVPLADIGSSFATSGAWYQASGYALAFLTHDISSNDAHRLLTELAAQCRSIIWEWGGKFELAVLPNFDQGIYDFVIVSDDVVKGPVFGYQPLSDTANRIMCLFRKDYRSNKETGTAVSGPITSEAYDQGFMDYLEDGWGARDLDETVRLTAIRENSVARNYLDWRLLQKKLPEKTISMDCHWRETLVTPGMVFRHDDAVEGEASYLVTGYQRDEQGKTIRIEGILLPSWNADDSTSETYADTPSVVQTHVLVADDAVSESESDNIGVLCWPTAQDATSDTYSDNLVVVQTHVLVADDSTSASFSDNAPLGSAWEYDAAEDLIPVTYTGVVGWWEDDGTSLEPRNTVSGSDLFWEADESGDLMPEAA